MGILRTIGEPVSTPAGFTSELSEGFRLSVDYLASDIVRIAVIPSEGLTVDRTWMISPEGDVEVEGRDRLSTYGYPAHEADKRQLRVSVIATDGPLQMQVEQLVDVEWRNLFRDRANGAWQWFEKSGQLKHFQALGEDEAHYGLGDKSGPLDRTGRRLRCLQSDALGYNAETSDPLYKHAPWVIVSNPDASAGLLYDTMAETVFDLGAEHSNYFERFRHVEMNEKGCVLYVLAGPSVGEAVANLHRLTGMPAMPPRHALGFGFTTMHHADHPQAQQVILNFAHEARERGLSLSQIHLGSGYTAGADGLRYVFNWNEGRFPDRLAFFKQLRAMGYRTAANVKPVLLTGHNAFEQAASDGWFVKRDDGSPAIEMFWGGHGAQLDFTNSEASQWWQRNVAEQVLGPGFDIVWNDNNEAELWDETATIDGFSSPLPGMETRPVHALLMTRASRDAMTAHAPSQRPWGISRAGPIGIARYGESWSGDNRTSWHTLKWNLRQGLSMSLSGFPFTGHDIGGFDGPPPESELLVRWFQMMALHPRCVMNSWKAQFDNIPNLPWMHEDAFPAIKAAMDLRARFMPLLYTLAYECHTTGAPMIAPTFFYFNDEACRAGNDAFMLGEHVLVAPVVEEGARQVHVYLPSVEEGWFDFATGEYFTGGETITISVQLDLLPVFIRGGTVLPQAVGWQINSPHDATEVLLRCYPVDGVTRSSAFFTDAGDGFDHFAGDACHWRLELECANGVAALHKTALMKGAPPVPIRYESAVPSISLQVPL
ncbi:TIM-barrel domain-containing protein [Ahrensia sp. R2A130]|uniref:glycoside hydrolase family 31 protein n=1 Tax=Ahrensia sp. R2A130 TaxID=744979 RepID=UPI0001E08BDD|nr:TIM-barrel domain-containing protein [Ahrensia sp. R2A130]EFL91056.1 alpha-glucosidase [Ahrensia sp. R2A130]